MTAARQPGNRWGSVLYWPLVITTVAWSYNFVSVKLLYREMTPMGLGLVRYVLMLGALYALCGAMKQPVRIARTDVMPALAAGAMAMGIYMVLFLYGMAGSTPSEGAILLATAPLVTYLLASCLRIEPFYRAALGGTCLAFVGVAIAVYKPGLGKGSLVGNGLVLLAAIAWGVSALMMRPLLAKYKPLPLTTFSLLGAFPILLAFGADDVAAIQWSQLSPLAWVNLTQTTLVSGVIAFLCFYRGVEEIGPSRATRYQFFVPVLALIFAWAIYNEPITWVQWVGVGVLIGGVWMATRARESAGAAVTPSPASDSKILEHDRSIGNG